MEASQMQLQYLCAQIAKLTENFKTCSDEEYCWYNIEDGESVAIYPILESLGYTINPIRDFKKKWYHKISAPCTVIKLTQPYSTKNPEPQTKNKILEDYHSIIFTQNELITYKKKQAQPVAEKIYKLIDLYRGSIQNGNISTTDYEIRYTSTKRGRPSIINISCANYWILAKFYEILISKIRELEISSLRGVSRHPFSRKYQVEIVFE